MKLLKNLKQRAGRLKAETYILYLAARHPETPWYAKLLVGVVVAYALSPIDLIPDFIPIVGYLDDLVLVPLGIMLVIKLVPPSVIAECRTRANTANNKPVSLVAGAVVVAIWLVLAAMCIVWVYKEYMPKSDIPNPVSNTGTVR